MSKNMMATMILMAAADKGGGNGDKSKSENWNKAVGKVTGAVEEATDAPDTTAVMVGGMEAMFSKATQDDINKLVNSPGLEFAPVVKSLEEGDRIDGFLVGQGPSTDFIDPQTNKTRTVNTWIISNMARTFSVSILSATQLERKLPPFVGGKVTIIRGKDLKTRNGFKVTDYMVAGPVQEDGKPRSFLALPTHGAPALPAGSNVIDAESSQQQHA